MTQAILGLDIGRDALKAVAVTSQGRVVAAERIAVTPEISAEAALESLAGRMPGLSWRVVLSLPASDVMLRRVSLPFRDDGRIKKALPFALEPLLPMPVEEVVFDYLRLPDGDLLVAAADSRTLTDWVARTRKIFGPVIAADMAGALLLAAAGRTRDLKNFGILLDIGRNSTTAVFFDSGMPLSLRTFAFGGRRITQALAEDLLCDVEEAEAHKIGGRFPESDGAAVALCRTFCAELKHTLESLSLSGNQTNRPHQILLSGGASLFAPLSVELTRALGVKPEALDFVGDKTAQLDAKAAQTFLPQRMNTALAAALRSFGSRRSFNFLRDDAAAGHPFAAFRGRIRRLAVALALIVLLAAGSLYLGFHARQAEADALKGQVGALFKKHMGQGAVMVDPVGQLKAKLAENEKAFGLSQNTSDLTMAELLKEISFRITPEVDLTLSDLYFEHQTVLLKGEAASMDGIAVAAAELAKSPAFAAVKTGSTSMSSDKTKVNFDLRLELK